MKEKRIGSLLIKKYESHAGIVSKRDLVYKVVDEGLGPKTILLTSKMTENTLSIEKNASSSKASALMI